MKFFHLLPFLLPILGAKSKEEKCGYEACPTLNPSELHVHLVAHSHDDVGWLKTVDQYYFGQQMGIQFAGIQYIIDSVVQALLADPKRKFIQVETAFFHKWWRRQHDKRKEQVRQLVNNGQLVIVGGGWSMNDEAAAHYQSIIDQFTYGIRFMEDTLGKCARPKIGWQIDPFGHTREMASIFNEMGYDAIFFARLDYRDKKKRLSTRTAEMLWRGSSNVGQPFLFTHAMFDHYSPPRGFKFDILSKDDPLVTDIRSSEYNLKEKVSSFTAFVKAQSSNYTSNNIMMAMGDDFTYQDAHYNYRNLDTLIKAYEDVEHLDNKLRRIRLHYSTPNCYVKAVNEYAKQKGLKYKVKTDDFIPYASDSSSYWTGYYTSRPTQKRLERQGNNLLQVAKQLTSAGPDSKTRNERVSELREAMSVMQHHDAITGTEKTKVAMDYVTMMSKAFESSSAVASEVLLKRLAKKDPPKLTFKSCLLANISVCEESRKQKFVAIVYNPLSRKVSHHVRLPVDTNDFDVIDFAGKKMEWQVTPSIDAFDNVPDIQKAKFDLVFFAEDLPALGAKIYYITNKNFGATDVNVPPVKDTFDLGDKETGAQLNRNTGFLKGITLHSWPLNLRQELMYYHGAIGNNRPSNRTSGAYVFRPDPKNPAAKPFTDSILSSLKVYKGKLVDEVHQTFDNAAKQIVRVYKRQKNYVEFDWLVGPIDISDKNGKEIISRFKLGTFNPPKGTFFTDSNGRELLKRVNEHRETFKYTDEEPVAGNYYPITSSITAVDEDRRIEASVLTDRAQGGASLGTGEMELMLHRRLLKDDGFGVDEALNELEFGKGLRVRGRHFFTFGSIKDGDNIPRASKIRRGIVQQKVLAPWVFLADASSKENAFDKLKGNLKSEFSPVTHDLPEQVQILTLERWGDNHVLLRLEHILEVSEGGVVQKIDVRGLFVGLGLRIEEFKEMTLAGNSKLDEGYRMQWTAGGCLSGLDNCELIEKPPRDGKAGPDRVDLWPMEIRTFIVNVEEIPS